MYVPLAVQFHNIVIFCWLGFLNPSFGNNGAESVVSVVQVYVFTTSTSSIPSFVHLYLYITVYGVSVLAFHCATYITFSVTLEAHIGFHSLNVYHDACSTFKSHLNNGVSTR